MKRKPSDLTETEKIKTLDMLYTAAAGVRGRNAMKLFLRDLLTESERIMLGRRIMIARLLISGEHHDGIAQRMRVGLATIYRVERWLHDQFPGFENAIKELEEEFARRKTKQPYQRSELFSYGWLKKKYPLYFLLFPGLKTQSKKARL